MDIDGMAAMNAGRSEAGVASEMAPKATVRAPVRIPLVNLIDSDHQRLVEEERADGVEEGDLRDEWSWLHMGG